MVGIPAYDRKIHAETARSLLNEQAAALQLGDEIQVMFAPGCSLISHARNQLVRDFLLSDADRLVFLDSDVAFELGSLLKISKYLVDFVGGAYRYKDAQEGYPVTWLETPELWANEHGLLEVAGLPAGFLSLSRNVFETHREKFPERAYNHSGQIFWAYFQCPYHDRTLFGEDGSFCWEWTEAGGKVWLDPELTLHHVEGAQVYSGCIGKWLKARIQNEAEKVAV